MEIPQWKAPGFRGMDFLSQACLAMTTVCLNQILVGIWKLSKVDSSISPLESLVDQAKLELLTYPNKGEHKLGRILVVSQNGGAQKRAFIGICIWDKELKDDLSRWRTILGSPEKQNLLLYKIFIIRICSHDYGIWEFWSMICGHNV